MSAKYRWDERQLAYDSISNLAYAISEHGSLKNQSAVDEQNKLLD
jgi:hypothetical protein